jgi:hypothetical protein
MMDDCFFVRQNRKTGEARGEVQLEVAPWLMVHENEVRAESFFGPGGGTIKCGDDGVKNTLMDFYPS